MTRPALILTDRPAGRDLLVCEIGEDGSGGVALGVHTDAGLRVVDLRSTQDVAAVAQWLADWLRDREAQQLQEQADAEWQAGA